MVGRPTITPAESERLAVAVAAAERETSAEIVVAVTDASDDYDAYPWLWTAAYGLFVSAVLALDQPAMPLRTAFAVVGASAFVLALILHFRPIRLWLVPAAAKQQAAARAAQLHFAREVAGATRDRNGVLLFVSVAEHHVEIIGDTAVRAEFPAEVWRGIVTHIVDYVRSGRALAEALEKAVGEMSAILKPKFPYNSGDPNEISDRPALNRR